MANVAVFRKYNNSAQVETSKRIFFQERYSIPRIIFISSLRATFQGKNLLLKEFAGADSLLQCSPQFSSDTFDTIKVKRIINIWIYKMVLLVLQILYRAPDKRGY